VAHFKVLCRNSHEQLTKTTMSLYWDSRSPHRDSNARLPRASRDDAPTLEFSSAL